MTDQIKSQLEIAAENLSIEFQRVLINEMSTEDGLVPVLMDIGSDPARYINIFSDEIIRLGAAYYKTITAWTELDEMGIDDYYPETDIDLQPDTFEEQPNREDVLPFPVEVQVDPYEQPDGDRHDRG
mgnify:FL=1|jgi:hypothetical protein